MDFNNLIIELKGKRLEYLTLLYSNSLLFEHLLNNDLKACLDQHDVVFCVRPDRPDGIFNISGDIIKKEINEFQKDTLLGLELNESIKNSPKLFKIICSKLQENNAHFLRTRTLNSFFETLKDWFKLNYQDEWGKLHSESWLQVLYLLRNIASHQGDDVQKVKFLNKNNWLPESYPDIVKWKTISIKREQLENTVRYNDKEILELIKDGIDYLEKHSEKYQN